MDTKEQARNTRDKVAAIVIKYGLGHLYQLRGDLESLVDEEFYKGYKEGVKSMIITETTPKTTAKKTKKVKE